MNMYKTNNYTCSCLAIMLIVNYMYMYYNIITVKGERPQGKEVAADEVQGFSKAFQRTAKGIF